MASIPNFFIRLFLRATVKKNKLHLVSIRSVRKSLEKLTALAPLPKNVEYTPVNCDGVPAEWTIAKNVNTDGVVLYLHGGGYVSGSIKTHRGLVGGLSMTSQTKCLSVDYRLAPEHPFPAGLDDAIKVYHWLLKQGVDPKKIVIAGDSAGGGLTMATLLRLRDENAPLPAAGVCLSPWLDLECTGDSATTLATKDLMIPVAGLKKFGMEYAHKENINHPYASPINANPTGLPPLFIQVSNWEILLDDTLRFEKKAKAAGVKVEVEIWEKMTHVWQAYGTFLPEAKQAVKKLGAYIYTKTK